MTPIATRRRLRVGRWPGLMVAGVVALSILLVLPLRWVDPPFSAFMAWHWIEGRLAGRQPPLVFHEWADWGVIAPEMALAVVAAEDQRFPEHGGFDLVEIRKAWQRHRDGGRLRGASTLSQQTAKNLYLWPGRDWLRKGLEAWLTALIELLWPKQRILEVYLNVAEFDTAVFGVEAAAQHHFGVAASALSARQAARLAAVLPDPKGRSATLPTPCLLYTSDAADDLYTV